MSAVTPPKSVEEALVLLLKAEERVVGKDGVLWEGRHYYAEELAGCQKLRVQIRYLPRIKEHVRVYDLEDTFICLAYCLDFMDEAASQEFRHKFLKTQDQRNAALREEERRLLALVREERPVTVDADAVIATGQKYRRPRVKQVAEPRPDDNIVDIAFGEDLKGPIEVDA